MTSEARADLHRIFDFMVERELARDDGDLSMADAAIAAVFRELRRLETMPFAYRPADAHSSLRELVIPFGASGFMALFQVVADGEVRVVAIRHQREEGYGG